MTTPSLSRAVQTIAICAIATAACATTTAPQARDAFPPPGSVTGSCRDGRTWTTSEAGRAQMFDELNRVRAAAGRPALVRHPVLDTMALAHAADMACRNYVDHRNSAGERLPARLARANDGSVPPWTRLAEVLGTSVAPARQVERWLDSRSHRRAVLEREHDRVGIGLVTIAGSKYDTYWVAEFLGNPRR